MYREILTHPHTIEHLEKWCKLLESIGRKALKLAKETGVKVPEEYVWYYKFGWLKIMIASLACLRSGVDMDMCFIKLKRNPHMQKIINKYKESGGIETLSR